MRRIEKSPKQKSPEWKKDICLKNKTQKNVKLVKKLQNKNDYNLELVLRIFFSFFASTFFYMIHESHESTHLVTCNIHNEVVQDIGEESNRATDIQTIFNLTRNRGSVPCQLCFPTLAESCWTFHRPCRSADLQRNSSEK